MRQPEFAGLRVGMVDVCVLDPEGWILRRLSLDPYHCIVACIDPDSSWSAGMRVCNSGRRVTTGTAPAVREMAREKGVKSTACPFRNSSLKDQTASHTPATKMPYHDEVS